MYVYIYDDLALEKKYEKERLLIEHRLLDLGLQGQIFQTASYRTLDEIRRFDAWRQAGTVVLLGSERLFYDVLPLAVTDQKAVAFLPLVSSPLFDTVFGIPTGVTACDVLSARIVETLDVGVVNQRLFFESVSFSSNDVSIKPNSQYALRPTKSAQVRILNLLREKKRDATLVCDSQDGVLDLVIDVEIPKKGWFGGKTVATTHLPVTQLTLFQQKPFAVQVDGTEMVDQTFDIRVLPQALRVVTGKKRVIGVNG